ncbi:MAG: hypothetical protein R3245_02390 [Kiloniellales bacterium]|nr:hypothetical protein [Kiloniellales bacterium]
MKQPKRIVNPWSPAVKRRSLLQGGFGLLAASTAVGRAHAALFATPSQTSGPFYPVKIPLDSDNDLLKVTGQEKEANGEVLHIFGQIVNVDGQPLSDTRIEIWQCDSRGYYHHPRDRGGQADPNFQGFGHNVSTEGGHFRFRTLVPVSYPGRTPHIHLQVITPDGRQLVTQFYIKDYPGNERDFLYRRLEGPQAKASVEMKLTPAPDLEAGSQRSDVVIVLA